ncbi:hypothetical protein BDF21DRAFT_427713 [Thamnidium elegans]|nr:hypothetical protein BDF21DRAFT_427713 [Thamnidium elegans]
MYRHQTIVLAPPMTCFFCGSTFHISSDCPLYCKQISHIIRRNPVAMIQKKEADRTFFPFQRTVF